MPVPVDLIKLSGVVKNNVVKKAVHDKLFAKIKNIYTGEFVLKTKYQMDKSKSEKTDFVKKTNLVELQSNIPDINGLATKTTSTAVKIKYLMLVV